MLDEGADVNACNKDLNTPLLVACAEGHPEVSEREREFFIDNLLVRVHRCFWCTGLAPWEFESPFGLNPNTEGHPAVSIPIPKSLINPK